MVADARLEVMLRRANVELPIEAELHAARIVLPGVAPNLYRSDSRIATIKNRLRFGSRQAADVLTVVHRLNDVEPTRTRKVAR